MIRYFNLEIRISIYSSRNYYLQDATKFIFKYSMRNIFNHELKTLKDWAVTSLTGRKHAADDIELIEFFYRSDIVFIYFLFFIYIN